jgi:hypothetical protein
VATSLTYAGRWTQTSGALEVASGDALTFEGAADSFTGSLGGAGRIILGHGADTLRGATISGGGVVANGANVTLAGAEVIHGSLTLNGAAVTVAATNASIGGGGTLVLSDSATNVIEGATASATLNVTSGAIRGAGDIGDGQMSLWVGASGIVHANGSVALILDTGGNSIVNHGLIEATGAGGLTITGAISNGGELAALGGNLTVDGAVNGGGNVRVSGGTADFAVAFSQNVTFGTTGMLELGQAHAYHGTITGLSHTGANSLDLRDIAYGGSTIASFSGSTASGVLTVTDGTHTARIKLAGNYLKSGFTLSSDGGGGTKVVDPTAPSDVAHALSAAMAGFSPTSGAAVSTAPATSRLRLPLLASPHTATA